LKRKELSLTNIQCETIKAKAKATAVLIFCFCFQVLLGYGQQFCGIEFSVYEGEKRTISGIIAETTTAI
jgi:hypothetical protein